MVKSPANAMDAEFLDELGRNFDALSSDPSVGAVIVTGTGTIFSAGVDLKRLPDLDVAGQNALVRGLNSACASAFGCAKPVIGAINGHAIAGGMVLALCCDYRIAVGDRSRYGLSEVRVGVPFPFVPYAIIENQLTPQALRRFIQFGQGIDAETARVWGALDEVVEPNQLMARARAKATECLAIPPGGYSKVKHQLRGEVADRCRQVVHDDSDPNLGNWISDEARAAAIAVLKGNS